MSSSIQDWISTMQMDQGEVAKIDFATTIDKAIRDKNWSRKDFAAAVNASPAWVTKVLRGDVNLTIETMAKLAAAVGWNLQISVTKPIEKSVTKTGTFSSALISAERKFEAFEFRVNRSAFSTCNDIEYLNAA